MSRLKLLLGSRYTGAPPAPVGYPDVGPSGSYNGTLGSGFSGSEPTPNHLSTVIKLPVCIEMTEQFTTFTQDTVIGFWAFCNPTLGQVTSVTPIIEGAEATSTDLSLRLRQSKLDGSDVTEAAYWFNLDVSQFAAQGPFKVYVKVSHTGGTDLIYGPLVYNYYTSEFDGQIEIAPTPTETSNRKKTFKAAVEAADALGYTRPQFYVTETASYEFAAPTGDQHTPTNTWRTFNTAPGVTATLANATLKQFRPGVNNIRLNGSFVLDSKNMIEGFYCEDGYSMWAFSMEGITWTNSDPLGRDYLINQTLPSGILREPSSNAATQFLGYVRDTEIKDVRSGLKFCRGWNVKVTRISEDALTSWRFCYGATITDLDPTFLRTLIDVATLTSSVPMTLAKTGSNGTTGTLVITKPGDPSSPYTISFSNTVGNANYLPSGIVSAINALGITGLTCTGITAGGRQDERRASYITKPGAAALGDFSATSLEGAGVTLGTGIDVHSDLAQYSANGNVSSACVLINIRGMTISQAQNIFFSGSQGQRNMLCINWEVKNVAGQNAQTHLGYYQEDNLGLVHVTIPEQDFNFEAAAYDGNGLYGLIAYKYFANTGTVTNSVGSGVFSFNQGPTTPPTTGLTGTLLSCTSSDFVDYAGGNLAPSLSGAFASNLIPRTYPYDINHKPRNSMTAATAREF